MGKTKECALLGRMLLMYNKCIYVDIWITCKQIVLYIHVASVQY